MDSIVQRPTIPIDSFAFDPDQLGLAPLTPPIYTCDDGAWRQYDGKTLDKRGIPFNRYESIGITTAKNGGSYLHLQLTHPDKTSFVIRQRCDGSSTNGLLQLTCHSLIQGLLGHYRMNGQSLAKTCGFLVANLGSKPGPSGFVGSFINVVDLTTGKPLNPPKVLLDRNLDTGEFAKAVEILSQSLYS